MQFIFDLAGEYIRSKLFSPKDYFERQKRTLIRYTFTPLFALIATPSLVVATITSMGLFELKSSGLIIRLIGQSSSDVYYLTGALLATFCFSVGANLIYGLRLKKIDADLQVAAAIDLDLNSARVLHDEYKKLILEGKFVEALNIGALISHQHPAYLKKSPELAIDMVRRGANVIDYKPALRLKPPDESPK